MSPLRIALAQINSTVGDLEGNARRIAEFAERAHAAGAHTLLIGMRSWLFEAFRDLKRVPEA